MEVRVIERLTDVPTALLREVIAIEQLPITTITLGRHLRRLNITRKKVVDQSLNWPKPEVVQEIRDYFTAISTVSPASLVYFDESFCYTNEAPKMGRSLRGQLIQRHRESHGKRYMFAMAIRLDGVVHPPAISTKTMRDEVFMSYVRAQLIPSLREGDCVIWDRLGKAGRAKNPCKQHYNPEARALIESKGARLVFLPPRGKYFNPIELLFSKVKTHIRNAYTGSTAAREKRHRTDREIIESIIAGCQSVSIWDIAGWFRQRGGTREFAKLYPHIVL